MNIKMELATFAIHIINHLDDTEYVQLRLPQVLQTVWDKQCQLGRYRFGIGWISKQWRKAAKIYGSKDPGGDVAKLVTLIWDGWCEPLWELRNNILHKQPNPTELSAHRKIKERLKWFKRHKLEALLEQFRFLTDFSEDDLKYWNRKNSRALLHHLEKGHKIYRFKCRQRYKGQRVITDWLVPTN